MFGKRNFSSFSGSPEYIIAGLGNPGREYENTRHNAGFIALDAIAEECGVKADRLKFKSLCANAVFGGKKVLLMKPSNFMNLSGESITEAMRFYKIPPEKTLIILDDISLPVGHLRIRSKGSDGGHNGMKNIIYLSGSDMFPRIKVGVGSKPHPDYDLADWVLSVFSSDDRKKIDDAADCVSRAAQLIVQDDITKAMNLFNGNRN